MISRVNLVSEKATVTQSSNPLELAGVTLRALKSSGLNLALRSFVGNLPVPARAMLTRDIQHVTSLHNCSSVEEQGVKNVVSCWSLKPNMHIYIFIFNYWTKIYMTI